MAGEALAWGLEWAWVGVFTSLATLVIIFNILLVFSVIKNSFLHYSFHYVVIAMALRYLSSVFVIFILFFLRNICRVGLTLVLAVLARLLESPEDLPRSLLAENHSDLREAASMPLVCEILSMTDHALMTVLMFYLSALSLYLFCRQPNPPVLASSLKTLRVRTYRIHSVLRIMFSCMVSHRAFCLFRRGGGYVLFFFSFPLSWLFVSVSLFSFSTYPTPWQQCLVVLSAMFHRLWSWTLISQWLQYLGSAYLWQSLFASLSVFPSGAVWAALVVDAFPPSARRRWSLPCLLSPTVLLTWLCTYPC